AAVPVLPGARELAELGHVPGGTERNLADAAGSVTWATGVDDVTRVLLCDAQTSGGLLISVGAERAGGLVEVLRGSGHAATVVGRVVAGEVRLRIGELDLL